jgi:hypothetical protein
MYDIKLCFICRPSDSTVSEDAGIEPGTVATTALAVRRSNHSARSHRHVPIVVYLLMHTLLLLSAKSYVNLKPVSFRQYTKTNKQ